MSKRKSKKILTAEDTRRARLYPWTRRTLAEGIRLHHKMITEGILTREAAKEAISYRREIAELADRFDGRDGDRDIAPDTEVMILAAARLAGVSTQEYISAALAEALDKTRRELGEIVLTRQEAAALSKEVA